MKKLPVGISTFNHIIKDNYLYIDKTKDALNLISNYKYAFLSRPRRFGKSLFLDTLKEIFEGNRELFNGLYIYNKYSFNKHPVIKISWAGDLRSIDSIKQTALAILKENQEALEIECKEQSVSLCFRELIQKAYKKYNKRVVVLIDEYDKAILDNLDQINEVYLIGVEFSSQSRNIVKFEYKRIK